MNFISANIYTIMTFNFANFLNLYLQRENIVNSKLFNAQILSENHSHSHCDL